MIFGPQRIAIRGCHGSLCLSLCFGNDSGFTRITGTLVFTVLDILKVAEVPPKLVNGQDHICPLRAASQGQSASRWRWVCVRVPVGVYF